MFASPSESYLCDGQSGSNDGPQIWLESSRGASYRNPLKADCLRGSRVCSDSQLPGERTAAETRPDADGATAKGVSASTPSALARRKSFVVRSARATTSIGT